MGATGARPSIASFRRSINGCSATFLFEVLQDSKCCVIPVRHPPDFTAHLTSAVRMLDPSSGGVSGCASRAAETREPLDRSVVNNRAEGNRH